MTRATAALLAVFVSSCASAPPPRPAPPQQPLYQRLGGKDAISQVVHRFLARVAADARINARFASTDLTRLETLLVEQICEAAGGPCHYSGRDMKATHLGMQIRGEEFDALVEDLQATLAELRVPAAEQGELLSVLGPMKPDIVETGGTEGAPAAAAPAPPVRSGTGPVAERAEGLREAAGLLDRAEGARRRGNRSLAEQLFSSAELIVGSEPLAALASLFREGAPPRLTAPPVAVARAAPQPIAVGSSADDDPDPRPARATLTGTVQSSGALEPLAVVTLEPVDRMQGRHARRSPRHRVIEQRQREFAPRLLAVPVGSTVTFPNFDPIYHNVFSRSEARPFDLGLYKSGQAREVVFDREGIVRVGCNLHANMSATVVVVAAPHYAITDRGGRFSFRSLEPGRYRLRAYSARGAEPTTQEIAVAAGANNVAVALPADPAPGPLADKFGVPRVAKIGR
jgi:hemoglobin